jgi:hypothetical protein
MASSLTRKRVCSLQCNHSLVRLLTPNNHTLPPHLRLYSLFVSSYNSQGLRWKYSNPPPHGDPFTLLCKTYIYISTAGGFIGISLPYNTLERCNQFNYPSCSSQFEAMGQNSTPPSPVQTFWHPGTSLPYCRRWTNLSWVLWPGFDNGSLFSNLNLHSNKHLVSNIPSTLNISHL